MAAADSVRKLAALAVIGVLIGTSAWLGPEPHPAPGVLPNLALPFVSATAAPLLQRHFAVDSEPARRPPFRVGSERRSERSGQELRTAAVEEPEPDVTLVPSGRLVFEVAAPPSAERMFATGGATNVVRRALATVGEQTSGALRTAGRAIRTGFRAAGR